MPNSSSNSVVKAVLLLVGAVMILAGSGWVTWMMWYFVRLNQGWEPSWDIALTYWWPCACFTFPFAFGLIIGGVWLVRNARTRTT